MYMTTFASCFFYIYTAVKSLQVLDNIESAGCAYRTSTSNLSADYIIAAVVPIHYKKIGGKYQFTGFAISWVESILYAIDQINRNKTLLPGVKLGYDIRESCDSQTDVVIKHTLDFVLDDAFIHDKVAHNSTCECVARGDNRIISVLGANTFTSTTLMSRVLTPYMMPQVSYSASSSLLNNNKNYPNFASTVPSARYETNIVADILRYFNLTYVSALASDDDEGRDTLDKLEDIMNKQNMCVAVSNLFDPSFPGRDLDTVVDKLSAVYEKTRVAVLWCKKSVGMKLITRAVERGLTNLTWITTWGRDAEMEKTSASRGVIDIEIEHTIVPDFIDHLQSIQWASPLGNPWFPLFGSAIGLKKEYKIPLGPIVSNLKHFDVMQAPYAVAHALHKLLKCNQISCLEQHKPINRTLLVKYIKEVRYTIPSTSHINQLSQQTHTGISYKISIYEPDFRVKKKTNETYYSTYVTLGHWKDGKVVLKQNKTIKWRGKSKPRALCSEDCPPGKRKPVVGSSLCCWQCVDCIQDAISVMTNQEKCDQCNSTQISNANHTFCMNLQDRSPSIETVSMQITLAVNGVGVLCALLIITTVLRNWSTPVVKSSSREITLIQLVSLMLLFLLPVLYISRLSPQLCVMQIVCFSTLYTQVVAFIVLKTYRLLCVFKEIRFTRVSKYLHSKYQIMFGFMLILLQLIALLVWYLSRPVTVVIQKLRRDQDASFAYYCEDVDTILYWVIAYIFLLSLSTGFMAFRARTLPQKFNEAQFIWFAMFTSCLAWLLFVPIYLSSNRYQKPVAFLIINTISSFCLMFILNGYKIAIILFYPHLNSKEHFQILPPNATLTTFFRKVESTNGNPPVRSREQSVISFDFDGMFNEYKHIQQNSRSLPAKKTHFPTSNNSLKREQSTKRYSSAKGRKKSYVSGGLAKLSFLRHQRDDDIWSNNKKGGEMSEYLNHTYVNDEPDVRRISEESPDSITDQLVIAPAMVVTTTKKASLVDKTNNKRNFQTETIKENVCNSLEKARAAPLRSNEVPKNIFMAVIMKSSETYL